MSNRINPSVFKPIPRIDLLFNNGGLGDSVARLPTVKFILDHCSHVGGLRVYVQDYFVPYAQHVFAKYGSRVNFVGYSRMLELIKTDNAKIGMNTDSKHHTTLHTHLTEHAFHTLLDESPINTNAYNYVQVEEHVQTEWDHLTNYVVITTGFTAPVREWRSQEINKVVRWLVANNILPVFLGKRQNAYWEDKTTEGYFREDIQLELGLNLIDDTSLLQASAIMSKARAVVGLDNGLLHLAAASSPTLPIVAAYTTVRPEHRLPYRHGVKGHGVHVITPEKSPCTFCQSEARFVHEHNFQFCYFDDYACTAHITGEMFIKHLERIL